MATPHHRVHHDMYALSSSPILPPLDQILSQPPKKPPPRGGSAAYPIPKGTTQAIATATSIFWAEHSAIDLTTPDKPPTAAAHDEADTSVSIIQIPAPGCGPKRRKGAPKVREKKIAPARANVQEKPGTTARSKSKRETVDRRPPKAKEEDNAPGVPVDAPLGLDAATRRRTDWTPPPPNTVISSESGIRELLSSATKAADAESREVFENLFQNFGRQEPVDDIAQRDPPDVAVLGKRKLVEMVTVRDSTAIQSPVKPKAPKKKPRTITELATAAYAVPDESMPPPADSMLKYLEQPGEPDAAKPKAKPRKPRATKSKKGTAARPILLSPITALKQVANQDFLFGTSSQLAREQSPTLLKDLQAALRASNRTEDDDPLAIQINSDAIEPEPRPRLWDVGARNDEGGLLDIEVIDLAERDEVSTSRGTPDPFGYGRKEQQQQQQRAEQALHDESFPDIEVLLGTAGTPNAKGPSPARQLPVQDHSRHDRIVAPELEQQHLPEKPPRVPPPSAPAAAESSRPQYDLYTDAQLARQVTSYGFKPIKRRGAMIALLNLCWVNTTGTASGAVVGGRAASTLALNSSAVQDGKTASNPTKKPRGRPRTASPSAANLTEPPPSAQPRPPSPKRPRGRPRKNSVDTVVAFGEPPPSAQPPPPSPKRPRGRPRKDTATNPPVTAPVRRAAPPATPAPARRRRPDVVEIPDSDSEGSVSSSPCSSPEHTFSSPPAVDVSLSVGDDTELSLTMSPTRQQSALFTHITKAVTTAPRTTDPSKPSWHEKMLMYDPIVLEDLAAWLNAGELTRAGYDGEVSPFEVKKWCESKSICCLWRESLRGRERKRY